MTLLVLLCLIAVPVVIGAAVTWQLWPNRRYPRVRKYLAVLWVGVLVAVGMLSIAVPLGIAAGVYQAYQWLKGVALRQGFPEWCATISACLLAVPLLYLCFLVLDPFISRKRRWGGLALLTLLFGTLFGLGLWFKTAIPGAFTLAGESKKGVVYLPDGRLKICNYPGQIDPITGRPCQLLTPSALQHLDPGVACGAKSVRIEEPMEFYDQSGEPMVWVCVNDEGIYYFVSVPRYIEPTTGKLCEPISAEWIQRYRQDQQVKKRKAEQERWEAERVAEQARVESERWRIEQKRWLAEQQARQRAEARIEEQRHQAKEAARFVEGQRRIEQMMREGEWETKDYTIPLAVEAAQAVGNFYKDAAIAYFTGLTWFFR